MKHHNNNKLLIAGIILMLWISYQFAIKNTLQLRSQWKEQKEQLAELADSPRQLALLQAKNEGLSKQLQAFNLENGSLQNNLLKSLSQKAAEHQVKIIDYDAHHISEVDGYRLKTYMFNLEGRFTDILKTIASLENQSGLGAVTHLGFEKKTEHRKKRTYLRVKVLVEEVL